MTPDEHARFIAALLGSQPASPFGADVNSAPAMAPVIELDAPPPMAMPPQQAPAPAYEPALSPPTFGQNVADSADRLARNPAAGPLLGPLGPLGGPLLAGYNMAVPKTRQPTSFVRDQPQEYGLQPMAAPEAHVTAAPTLNPRYGQVGRSMTGGVGGTNPLKAAWEASQKQQLRTLGEQKELEGDLGMARVGKTLAMADAEDAHGQRVQQDAMEQQKIDNAAHTRLESFLARNQQLADEIGKMKPDSSRYVRNKDTGTQIAMGIGAVVGGMLGALNGTPNEFLDRLDKLIDRDVNDQMAEIDNKKASLSARQSMFGQMLAETGDHRLAAQQTRILMYEGVKTQLKATGDRLGVPEMRANAELAANATQQKIDGLKENMAAVAWKTYLANAAAAAAAQKAAEAAAWQRAMDVARLGLEKDKVTVDLLNATKGGQKVHDDQLRDLSKDLANPEMIQNSVAVEGAMRRLIDPKTGKIDPHKGLPGVGPGADFREKLAPRPSGINTISPFAWATHKTIGLDSDERVSRQDWNQLKLGYRHLITGSGGGEKELADIGSAFEGATSPEEQANAVEKLYATVNRLKETKRAGYDPAVVEEFDQKMKASPGATMPASVQVKR